LVSLTGQQCPSNSGKIAPSFERAGFYLSGNPNFNSPNFQFLAAVNPLLAELGARAERYALDDPNTSMMKSRQLGELLAQSTAAKYGLQSGGERVDQHTLLGDLSRLGALPSEVKDLFHEVRKAGNQANHAMQGDQGRAITLLRHVRKIAVWYYRSHHNGNAKLGAFSPPLATASADDESRTEIERLRKLYETAEAQRRKLLDQAADEAELRRLAEDDRAKAYADLDAAVELASETEEKLTELNSQISTLTDQLNQTAATVSLSANETAMMVSHAAQVAQQELSESDTREIIDSQLRAAGWIADSVRLKQASGTRPQKGKNLAIAEWQTSSGPADYVLFIGLMPVAVVEAKKASVDVSSALSQSQRYSRDFLFADADIQPGGPWPHSNGEYHIPFLYSTNGREYLKQLETKSGIWFHDIRHRTNHPGANDGWHSPADRYDNQRSRLALRGVFGCRD